MMMTEQTGIVLDFSHLSATDLDFAVIWYAHKLGWDGGQNDIPMIAKDWDYYENGETPDDYIDMAHADGREYDEEDFLISFPEALHFACDDAVEWLNSNRVDDYHYYEIDDNSLYYRSSL